MLAGAAAAQVPSTLTTNLGPSNPTATMAAYSNSLANCVENGGFSGVRRYHVASVTLSVSGTYSFNDVSSQDGMLGIYAGAFSPANLSQNCVVGVDDGRTVNVPSGTYTLVYFDYNTGVSPPQTISFNIDGPAAVVAGPAVGPATVPTMSEWAMILFGTMLAGGAALFIQRRRQIV